MRGARGPGGRARITRLTSVLNDPTTPGPMAVSAPYPARRRAIFLDRDGTVLEDEPHSMDPARMKFAPGARRGLGMLAELKCPLIVVSSHADIAGSHFPADAVCAGIGRLHEMFVECGATLSGFTYCPHATGATSAVVCGCRKPAPGLLLAAAAELGIDLAESWMVGGHLDDIEAGRRAGCHTVLIDNGTETQWRSTPLRRPHTTARDLADAAGLIRRWWNQAELLA